MSEVTERNSAARAHGAAWGSGGRSFMGEFSGSFTICLDKTNRPLFVGGHEHPNLNFCTLLLTVLCARLRFEFSRRTP